MKKCNVMLSVLLALILVTSVGSANASISSWNWIAPLVKGDYDSFYGTTITGYQSGTAATLVVNVWNHMGIVMNVSAVKVWFDWGENFTSTDVSETNIHSIDPGTAHVFTVTFTIPGISVATNLVTHSYRIYVEDVNATTGPLLQLNNNSPRSDGNFAVLSDAQAEFVGLGRELQKYQPSPFLLTAKGRELVQQAIGSRTEGSSAYMRGDFSGAVIEYQNALSLMKNAVSNETSTISGFENALMNMVNGAQNALNMMGYGYTLFGIGFLLMGIGALVYLARKSGTPKPSQ